MALVVVVGAAGFIGRQVAAALREQATARVLGVDRGDPPSASADAPEDWIRLDLLRDADALATRLGDLRPDAIVNCAGATAGSDDVLMRANVVATTALLNATRAAAAGVRFVHVGSAAEYGPGIVGVPVTEAAPTRPSSTYGVAKLAATELVTSARGTWGLDAIVLRLFNVLGPGMPEGTLAGAALHRLRHAVATGEPAVQMGPLDAVRDFVDIRDVAAAVVAAVVPGGDETSIVNIGSGIGHRARDLVDALARRVGFSGRIGEDAEGSSRSLAVPWQVADRSLAGRVLGWRPVHDLESSAAFMTARTTEDDGLADGSGQGA